MLLAVVDSGWLHVYSLLLKMSKTGVSIVCVCFGGQCEYACVCVIVCVEQNNTHLRLICVLQLTFLLSIKQNVQGHILQQCLHLTVWWDNTSNSALV